MTKIKFISLLVLISISGFSQQKVTSYSVNGICFNVNSYKGFSFSPQYTYSKYKQFLAIKKNKYFNALQVKFSYAMTCHKSQGGQWKTVFIEQPYLPDGVSKAYFRWLYTAITRAKDKLYLIGFKDDYFTD